MTFCAQVEEGASFCKVTVNTHIILRGLEKLFPFSEPEYLQKCFCQNVFAKICRACRPVCFPFLFVYILFCISID